MIVGIGLNVMLFNSENHWLCASIVAVSPSGKERLRTVNQGLCDSRDVVNGDGNSLLMTENHRLCDSRVVPEKSIGKSLLTTENNGLCDARVVLERSIGNKLLRTEMNGPSRSPFAARFGVLVASAGSEPDGEFTVRPGTRRRRCPRRLRR